MLTVDQIVTNIINQLRFLDPTASAEVGTPERKIIEAVAEMIAGTQVDFTILNQQHDLDSMAGGRLDAYLSIFNFGRQMATPSYGIATFSRTVAATNAILIPQGTQLIAHINDTVFPSIVFITTQTAVLEAGSLSVDAPIQCTVAGTIGNIDAEMIVGFGGLKNISGITRVTNLTPTMGGTDGENDAVYKTRFQNTFLRNISGTYDMFLALAVAMNGVSRANVVGPMSRYQEYIQIPTTRDNALKTATGGYDDDGTRYPNKRTTDVSTIPYSKYTWPNNFYVTNGTLDPASAAFFRPDVDFVFNSVPVVTTATGTNEIQTVTVDATGGTFKLSYENVQTGTIAENASAATVETALEGLSSIGAGNVDVTGSAGGPYTVTFQGELKYRNVPMLVGDATGLTGGASTVVIAQSTPGVASTQTNGAGVGPNVTILNPTNVSTNPIGNPDLPLGEILLLEHAYCSRNSRNDPNFAILNCVDTYIDGEHRAQASSIEVVPDTSHNLQNTTSTVWTYQKQTATKVINFRRDVDGAECDVGNRLQPLYWQPVVGLPQSIKVGTATYYRANYYNSGDSTYYNSYVDGVYSLPAHYCLAIEVNSYYGTVRARNGIEWFLVGNNYQDGQLPNDTTTYTGPKIDEQVGSEFSVEGYLYDQNVSDLQAIVEKNKQITQDVLVHRAKRRYFRPVVTVMYAMGATKTVADAAVVAALDVFFRNQYFGSAIQLSDILQVIHSVPGIDNVRWTNDSPGGNKMEEVGADGSTLDGGPIWITTDFYIEDSELPASPSSNAVTITVRAQNTWGT